MPGPSQPKWVIDEALALYQSGSTSDMIAKILAQKGVTSMTTGVPCNVKMVQNWIRNGGGSRRKVKSSPADISVTLAPKDPEDGDLALLRTILDSGSYDKSKKLKMFKNLLTAMDA